MKIIKNILKRLVVLSLLLFQVFNIKSPAYKVPIYFEDINFNKYLLCEIEHDSSPGRLMRQFMYFVTGIRFNTDEFNSKFKHPYVGYCTKDGKVDYIHIGFQYTSTWKSKNLNITFNP